MRRILGLAILAVVALGALAATQLDLASLQRAASGREPATVSIYFGGEKSALLANPAIRSIIEGRYGVTLEATKAGSVEMATTLDHAGRDCLWPSNMVAVELARAAGKPVQAAETIFNSPIVFYAWAEVADALADRGAVTRPNAGPPTADVAMIAGLITEGARWQEDLGLKIYGPFKVFSTDPTRSNSGNIWSGLLATALNQGATPTEADLPGLLPRLDAYFEAMGHMEGSSGDIFANFLKQGMGSRPIIVGYENQLVEFLGENAEAADLIRERIRVLYPEPTIFASHPLISLTPACARLAEALSDPEVQAIAWRDHGFRTGLIGVENDPAEIEVADLPADLALVAPMPAAPVMTAIIDTLR